MYNHPRTEYDMKGDIHMIAFSASTAEIERANNKTKLDGVRTPTPQKKHRANEMCVFF
jgi:hypothetical protein